MMRWSIFVLAVVAALTASSPAMAALTAYWSFDTDYTSSVNSSTMNGTGLGNVGISTAAGTYAAGGGALMINDNATGVLDCVHIDSSLGSIYPNTPETIVVGGWYNRQNIDGTVIDSKSYMWETGTYGAAATGNYAVSASVDPNDTGYFFRMTTDGTTATNVSDTSGPAITNGQWNHIVMVANQTTHRVKYYHNGVLRDVYYCPELSLIPHDDFFIGSSRYNDGSRNWDGYLDEIFIADHEPTPEAIAGLYNGTYTPATMPTDAVTEPIRVVSPEWTLTNEFTVDAVSGLAVNPVNGALLVGRRTTVATTGAILSIDTTTGTPTQVATVDRPYDVVCDAAGNFFHSQDYNGVIVRNNDSTSWVSAFMGDTVDDDPGVMAFVPATFDGGPGSLVMPGQALVVDYGSGGIEQIYVWSPTTAEGEFVLHADSDVADGVGSPLFNPAGIAVSDSTIYVSDQGANVIYTVNPVTGALTALTTAQTIVAPGAMEIDPNSGDLFVLSTPVDAGASLFRIDPSTGVVTLVADQLASNSVQQLAFSPDGKKLYIGEYVTDAVYELTLVPEPSTLAALLGMAVATFVLFRRRRG